ncbi:MAG: alpha/beta hydrolase [Pseudomonadota bacterium]
MDWTPGRDLYLSLPDGRLEARCWGPPPDEAPTLVLLHEGLGCVRLWRDFPQQLTEATGWGVFAFSRYGYGASDMRPLPWPLDYMTIEAMAVLPQVLRAAGLRTGVLLGHSDGGTIAAVHQGLVPDPRIYGAILLAPHFFVEDCSVAAITAAGAAYPGGLRDKLSKYHSHVDCAFHGWHDSWLDPGFRNWNVSDVIPKWKKPVMALQGLDDPYGTRAQVDVIADLATIPAEVHVLANCQHAPHQQQTEQTLALVSDFLSRIRPV